MRNVQLGFVAVLFAALLAPGGASGAKRTSKSAKKSSTKSPAKKSTSKAAAKKAAAPKAAPVSAATAQSAQDFVNESLEKGLSIPVDNPAALVPFFEQLYRHQQGELPGPVRVLQYGDSHTAADDFSGELRSLFQASFGNGGSGFSYAGRPWRGYRRRDVRTGFQ